MIRPVLVHWRPFIVRAFHGKLHDVGVELAGDPPLVIAAERFKEAVEEATARIRENMEESVRGMMEAFARLTPTAEEAARNLRQFQGCAFPRETDDDA